MSHTATLTIDTREVGVDALAEDAIELLRARRSAMRLGLGPKPRLRLADTTRRVALALDEDGLVAEPAAAE